MKRKIIFKCGLIPRTLFVIPSISIYRNPLTNWIVDFVIQLMWLRWGIGVRFVKTDDNA